MSWVLLKYYSHRCIFSPINSPLGLDKSIRHEISLDAQADVFQRHLLLAKRFQRTLTVHCVQAWGRLLEVISAEDLNSASVSASSTVPLPPLSIVLHGCNTIPVDLIRSFLKLRHMVIYFSITVGRAYGDDARDASFLERCVAIPLTRILFETDCPDGLPAIFRDTLYCNSPSLLQEGALMVASKIAKQVNRSVDEVLELVFENSLTAYHL